MPTFRDSLKKKSLVIIALPYYVMYRTGGRFLDELGTGKRRDELLLSIWPAEQKTPDFSQPPEVEDYEEIFARGLPESPETFIYQLHNAKHASQGYYNCP